MNSPANDIELKTPKKRLLKYALIISTTTILLYYLIIEELILRVHIGRDIDMIWDAIAGDISEIYNLENSGYIYPPHFWYQFWLLRFSRPLLDGFMLISHIFSFPIGLYLINKKFNLKNPYILMWVLYPTFLMDVIVRNINTFIFLIVALIIYYYDKKPILAGLLFWFISFKITAFLIIFLFIFEGTLITKRNFLIGFVVSTVFIFIFFPISGYTLLDYWNKVTIDMSAGEESFNFVLSLSRAVRFNHMIWITPIIFSITFKYFTRNSPDLLNNVSEKHESIEKYFKKSIIFCIIAEIIFGILGLIAFTLYMGGP